MPSRTDIDQCCHSCRPTYRERAWQALNKVIREPCVSPPWELDNRPISDASMLAKIGLSTPRDAYEEFSYMIDAAFGTDNLSTQLDDTESRFENTLTRQRTHSFRHKSEFEEAVRGVIEMGAEESGFANQHNRQVSSSSSHGSLAGASRSMLFMRTAANHVKPNAPSTSQLSLVRSIGGEVEVADGVAVREEGVNMGVADIMTQV